MRTFGIESRSNNKIKELLKQSDNLFIFEGEKLVLDILARKIKLKYLIVHENVEPRFTLREDANVEQTWVVSDGVMNKVSSLKEQTGLIAVVESIERPVDFNTGGVIIGLDNIQDPANAGTVFRCAAAFGADGVVFSGGSVSFRNRKFLRGAQNALFDVPHQRFPDVRALIEEAETYKLPVYLTSSHIPGSLNPQQVKSPCMILLGNEGKGLDSSLFQRFPSVTIPQTEKVESLNVGVSACILCYQLSLTSVQGPGS